MQEHESHTIDLGCFGEFKLIVDFFGKHGDFCYQTMLAACADLPAQEGTATDEPEWHRVNKCWVLRPGSQAVIGTGLRIAHYESKGGVVIPKLIVKGRSSLSKKGIYAHLGTVDMDYVGHEIKAIIENRSAEPYVIQPGDRIAQVELGICMQIPGVAVKSVVREGGFGSTGV